MSLLVYLLGCGHLRPQPGRREQPLHDGGDIALDVGVGANVVALVPWPARALRRAGAAGERAPVSRAGRNGGPARHAQLIGRPWLAGACGSLGHPPALVESPWRRSGRALPGRSLDMGARSTCMKPGLLSHSPFCFHVPQLVSVSLHSDSFAPHATAAWKSTKQANARCFLGTMRRATTFAS